MCPRLTEFIHFPHKYKTYRAEMHTHTAHTDSNRQSEQTNDKMGHTLQLQRKINL